MKITKQLLREIIKEEIANVLLKERPISDGSKELLEMHPELVKYIDDLRFIPQRRGTFDKVKEMLVEIHSQLRYMSANIKPGAYAYDKNPVSGLEIAAQRSAAILGVLKRLAEITK